MLMVKRVEEDRKKGGGSDGERYEESGNEWRELELSGSVEPQIVGREGERKKELFFLFLICFVQIICVREVLGNKYRYMCIYIIHHI